jgi:hypothetical protein
MLRHPFLISLLFISVSCANAVARHVSHGNPSPTATSTPVPNPGPAAGKIGKSWPHRQPIGRVILADESNITSSNLNGWNDGGPHALGIAGFEQDILGRVNNAIYYVQQMHGQGIIIWDIAGCGCTKLAIGGGQYLGDPRFLAPLTAGLTVHISYSPYVPPNSALGLNGVEPAMNAIADQAFAAIRSAGLIPGVCLRGQATVVTAGGDLNGHINYALVSQQLEDLDAKVVYAYKRWGCRIFYVDSNNASTDVTSSLQAQHNPTWAPAWVYTQLNLRHPDCVIFPEEHFNGFFNYSAPVINDATYQYERLASRYTQLDNPWQGPFLTSTELAAVPDAFTLISCANMGTSDPADTPNVLSALKNNRCILMADAWYNSPEITLIFNWQTSAGVNGF